MSDSARPRSSRGVVQLALGMTVLAANATILAAFASKDDEESIRMIVNTDEVVLGSLAVGAAWLVWRWWRSPSLSAGGRWISAATWALGVALVVWLAGLFAGLFAALGLAIQIAWIATWVATTRTLWGGGICATIVITGIGCGVPWALIIGGAAALVVVDWDDVFELELNVRTYMDLAPWWLAALGVSAAWLAATGLLSLLARRRAKRRLRSLSDGPLDTDSDAGWQSIDDADSA